MKIISNATYKDLHNQITNAENACTREIYKKNKIAKEKAELKIMYDNLKKESTVITNNLLTISTKNEKLILQLSKSEEKARKFMGQTGGLQKEINKLKNIINAKDNIIQEYKIAINDLKMLNENQKNKIIELLKNVKHSKIEYKNNGLSKHTRKAIKKGEK